MLRGKKGVIMGIANNRSLAAGIAERFHALGARLAYSHLPDDCGKMRARIDAVVGGLDPVLVAGCDVNRDDSVAAFFAAVAETMGEIDFLVHSIGYAPVEDLRCATLNASREGFRIALETSAYSLIAVTRAAAPYFRSGASVLTLSYLGGERVVDGYNLMGVAKAALECSVRYLAEDLGPRQVRVNAISAGPVKTLAASAIGQFSRMLRVNADLAPLRRATTREDVSGAAAFLCSELASGVTGETIHVDCGYHVVASPRADALDAWASDAR